jgi:hypothetical protein
MLIRGDLGFNHSVNGLFQMPSICWLAIHEPLAVGFFQRFNDCAWPSVTKPRVVPVVKLGEIKRQVLFADMMECPDHAAL